MHGGGHERGMRFDAADAPDRRHGRGLPDRPRRKCTENARIRVLHHACWRAAAIEQVFINGHLEKRVPHNLNMSFNYVGASR